MKKNWKVIYYTSEDGKCPVKEFIDKRSIENQRKIAALIDYLQEIGINLPRPYSDYLKDGIHELRVKLSGDQSRTMYFFCFESFIVLTHSFIKTTQKVPESEIRKAIKFKKDFLKRFNTDNIDEAT
jgi:phage-related protein